MPASPSRVSCSSGAQNTGADLLGVTLDSPVLVHDSYGAQEVVLSERRCSLHLSVDVKPHELDRFGRTHHGLISFGHATALGMTRREWNRLVSDERRFELVYPDVARVLGAPTSVEQRIAAAVLAAGPGARASHRSGARVWDVSRPDHDPIDVMLPARSFDDTNIVVECDGWTTHGVDRTVVLSDRDKDSLLHANGYVVQRVTRQLLLFRPRLAAERVAGCLWSFAPRLARRHLQAYPDSVLGATETTQPGQIAARGTQKSA